MCIASYRAGGTLPKALKFKSTACPVINNQSSGKNSKIRIPTLFLLISSFYSPQHNPAHIIPIGYSVYTYAFRMPHIGHCTYG